MITVASNTGTLVVYGATCLIAVIASASRRDHHPLEHLVLPGLGALMNIGEVVGVLYVGFSERTGTTPGDQKKVEGSIAISSGAH